MNIKRFVFIFVIFAVALYTLYLYLIGNLTSFEKSRAIEVITNVESTATSIAHDVLTLSIDNSLRKENVIVITKDEAAVIEDFKHRFMQYVKTNPNLRITKNDITVKLYKGKYNKAGVKINQLPTEYPKIEVTIKGHYYNGAGIKNIGTDSGLIPIEAYTKVELEQLTVNKVTDNRDQKTIKGLDLTDYGKLNDNGNRFDLYNINER